LTRVRVECTSTAARAGLEALLRDEPGIEVVTFESQADVVLREDMPEMPDGEFGLPTVLLTDDLSLQKALRSGARAVLPRNATPSQIVAAIHAASAGLVAVPAEQSLAILSPVPEESIVESLTPREMDVIEMLAEGISNKLIADRLGISEHTAKFHVNSILAKLDANTRTEAVMRGLRLGLIKI